MSIKRCPYCKAIVDDSSEYCASCGTKLLFPEDEIKGENVPGEKILDDIPDPDEAELILEEEEPDETPEMEAAPDEKENVDEDVISTEEEDVPLFEDEELISEKEENISEGQDSEFEEVYSSPDEDSRNIDVELQKLKYMSEESSSWLEADLPSGEEKEELDESLVSLDELTGEAEDAKKEDETDKGGIEDSVYHMRIKEDEDKAVEKDGESSKPLPEILPDSKDFDDEKENFLPPEEVNEEQAETDDFLGPEELDDPDESSEDEAADYRAGDQLSIFDPVEKEKEDIERFLKSLRKERREQKPEIPETGTELPPWAKKIQKEEITDAEEKAGADEQESAPFHEEKDIPEILQVEEPEVLPDDEQENPLEDEPKEFIENDENDAESPEINIFENDNPEDGILFEPVEEEEPDHQELEEKEEHKVIPDGRDWMFEEDATSVAEGAEVVKETVRDDHFNLFEMESTAGSGLARWIKRRIVDVLLVGVVWFIALILASFVMEKTVFQLIRSSASTVFLFLGVLIIQYFFLFYFFLGSTLGDRLFTRKD